MADGIGTHELESTELEAISRLDELDEAGVSCMNRTVAPWS